MPLRYLTAAMAVALAILLFLGPSRAQAQFAGSSTAQMQIVGCVVYATKGSQKSVDCLAQAKKICGEAKSCELPIDASLSNETAVDLKTWNMVEVSLMCDKEPRTRGPYPQNDHATMTLTCMGR